MNLDRLADTIFDPLEKAISMLPRPRASDLRAALADSFRFAWASHNSSQMLRATPARDIRRSTANSIVPLENLAMDAARTIGKVAAVAFLLTTGAAATPVTFRTTTSVELTNLDPIATTAPITIAHGLMVYDTLFGVDESGHVQPQMIDSYTLSPDGLIYRFKLRPGLLFSDGSPVASKDVIASIKRWAAKRSEGRLLNARLARLAAIDETSFEIDLKKPFAQLIAAFADPVLPMFVMREQEADTDPSVPITNAIGSGPFVFRQDLSRPDDVVVYDRSPTYRPRNEPASGQAGGKVVNVDRVEERYMPSDTALEALKNDALDFIYSASQEAIDAVRPDPRFTIRVLDRQGMMSVVHFNTQHPPFDSVYARMAVHAAINQTVVLSSMTGDSERYRICDSRFGCGATPFESMTNVDGWNGQNMLKARELLRKSDCDGRPIVIMIPLDDDQLFNQGVALTKLLRATGFTVDAQSTVWSALVLRQKNNADPAKDPDGWDLYGTWTPVDVLTDPFNTALDTSGDPDAGWRGWSKDEIETFRDTLADAPSLGARQRVADEIQSRFDQTVPQIYAGEFHTTSIWRSNVTGIVSTSYPVFWNLKMNESSFQTAQPARP